MPAEELHEFGLWTWLKCRVVLRDLKRDRQFSGQAPPLCYFPSCI